MPGEPAEATRGRKRGPVPRGSAVDTRTLRRKQPTANTAGALRISRGTTTQTYRVSSCASTTAQPDPAQPCALWTSCTAGSRERGDPTGGHREPSPASRRYLARGSAPLKRGAPPPQTTATPVTTQHPTNHPPPTAPTTPTPPPPTHHPPTQPPHNQNHNYPKPTLIIKGGRVARHMPGCPQVIHRVSHRRGGCKLAGPNSPAG